MTQSFKVAPYGVTAWIWTASFIVLTLYVGTVTITTLANGHTPDAFDGGMTVALIPLLVYAWVRSVRGYRLEGGDIVIDRAGPGKIHIPLAGIEQVTGNPDLGSFFNVGLLSIGGVFGWAGKVRVRKPSDIHSVDAEVYGTNSKSQLLLEMKNGNKIILTPSDPQAMETSLRIAGVGALPRSGRGAGSRPKSARGAKRKT